MMDLKTITDDIIWVGHAANEHYRERVRSLIAAGKADDWKAFDQIETELLNWNRRLRALHQLRDMVETAKAEAAAPKRKRLARRRTRESV